MYSWNPAGDPVYEDDYRYYQIKPTHNPPIRNGEVITHRISTLTCPSDEPQIITDNANGLPVGATYHNYVANYGNTNHVGSSTLLGPKYAGSPFIGSDPNPPTSILIPFKRITDGLSKTMMFSETVQGHDNDLRGFAWWGWSAGYETAATPNSSDSDYLQQDIYCVSVVPNPPCIGAVAGNARAVARSRHPGGVNVAMCDSSIQFVVDDVDLDTWRAASTTRGYEVYQGLIQ
jgi:prepilin-type processing-associated H-X9-DG protein